MERPRNMFFKDYVIIPDSKTVVLYGQRMGSTILNSLSSEFPHAVHHVKGKTMDNFLELLKDHEVAIIVRDPIARIKSGLSVAIPQLPLHHPDNATSDAAYETLARDSIIQFKAELQREVNESKWHIKKSGLINYSLGDSHLDWCTEILFYFVMSLGIMPKLYWLQGWEANTVNSINLPNMMDFGETYFEQYPKVKHTLSEGYSFKGREHNIFSEIIHDKRFLIYQQIFSNATPHRIPHNKSRNNYISNSNEYTNVDGKGLIPRNPDTTFLTSDDIKFYSFNDYMTNWYKMFNTMVTIGQDVNWYEDDDRYSSDRCKQIARDMVTDIYQDISTKMNLDWIKQNYWKPAPGQHFLNMIEFFKVYKDVFPQYNF